MPESAPITGITGQGGAYQELGWRATTTLEQLMAMMMDADLQRVERE